MIVKTITGSVYEFTGYLKTRGWTLVRRVHEGAGGELRGDEDWLVIQQHRAIVVGIPMILTLEPLGEGFATVRRTSVVTDIEDEP